jgi:hypothetical protein
VVEGEERVVVLFSRFFFFKKKKKKNLIGQQHLEYRLNNQFSPLLLHMYNSVLNVTNRR